MGRSNSRLAGAIDRVREAIAAATLIPLDEIQPDQDLIDDLGLDPLELESLGLILEEVFSVRVPDCLFRTPLYRHVSTLAEWAIQQSDHEAWIESRRPPQRRRA